VHGSVLAPLKTSLLLLVVLVTTNGESVSETRVVLVVVWDVERRNDLVTVLLELGGVLRVVLRGVDLDWHGEVVNLFLGEKRWVGYRGAVDQVLAFAS